MAAPARRRVVVKEEPPDHRPDPVGPNQHVTFDGASVGQSERHDILADTEPHDVAAERNSIRAEGFDQHIVQRRTKHDGHRLERNESRDIDASQNAAVRSANLRARRHERPRADGGVDTQFPQCGHGIRRQTESEPDRARHLGPLEDPHLPPRPLKREPGGKTANAGTDN